MLKIFDFLDHFNGQRFNNENAEKKETLSSELKKNDKRKFQQPLKCLVANFDIINDKLTYDELL